LVLRRVNWYRVAVITLLGVQVVLIVLLWFQTVGISSSARTMTNIVDHQELRMFCADKSPGLQVRQGSTGTLTCENVMSAP
jgi:hypothetical protein